MAMLDKVRYSRVAALTTIGAFLAGNLPLQDFRDWVDAYDWDVGASDGDPHVREALAQLELVFHEVDDGSTTLDKARDLAADVQRLLTETSKTSARP